MPQRPLISLTMIVKNEAANIARVLESARGIADEVVVVDTGSTDETVAIATALGAKVCHFTWIQDFSAARNYAIEQATGEWILILDGDDVAVEREPGAVRAEVTAQPREVQFLRVPVRNPRAGMAGFSVISSRRLFRRCAEIRWYNPIHEVLRHATDDEAEVGTTALTIDHVGYMDVAHRKAERKNDRNLRILRGVIAERPDEAIWRYYLAKEYAAAGRRPTALRIIRSALHRFAGKVRPDFEGAMRCLAMNVAMQMKQPALAVKLGLPSVREYAYSELCYTLGCAYAALGDLERAERYYRLAIALRGRLAEFQKEAGTGSWKPMIELGRLAWNAGDRDLALERWRSAYDWAPDQPATNLALGQGLLIGGTVAHAEPFLRRAVELSPEHSDAHLRLGQALAALGRHQEAYDHLEGLTREQPEEPNYWLWTADLLQAMGEDEACVELMSRAVAAHPQHADVYQRLGASLRRLGRLDDAENAFTVAVALAPDSAAAQAGLLGLRVAVAA